MASSPDRGLHRGHVLLSERLQSIPGLLERWAASAPAAQTRMLRDRPRRVVATGLGSSEAHARYLVWLLNRFTDIPAEFVPTGALMGPMRREDRTLVVFSQGLSTHGRIALAHRGGFAGTVLFTSATVEGLRQAGRTDRAECLESLQIEGAQVVGFPIEGEYTLLIRVVGPALGFLAARLWVGSLAGDSLPGDSATVGVAAAEAFRTGVSSGRSAWPRMEAEAWSRGFVLLASPDLSAYLQNLAYKFVEGLFRPAPAIHELLQFAHGPFQQLTASPRPVVVLHRAEPAESDQLRRIQELCRSASIPCLSPGLGLVSRPDLLIFEAEGLFVESLLEEVRREGIDQVEWPGRGLDGPLYDYGGPIG